MKYAVHLTLEFFFFLIACIPCPLQSIYLGVSRRYDDQLLARRHVLRVVLDGLRDVAQLHAATKGRGEGAAEAARLPHSSHLSDRRTAREEVAK